MIILFGIALNEMGIGTLELFVISAVFLIFPILFIIDQKILMQKEFSFG